MTGTSEWAVVFREAAVGLGVLLIGIGILYASVQVGKLLERVGATLDEVDRQLAALGAPVAKTLDHVNGIANTADETLARVGGVVETLETVSSSAAKGVGFVGSALQPSVVNLGATLTGITAGVRRLVRGHNES
ncbi:MAG: hypothetical protein JO359_10765 [Candidatus Eremiobacteraeota bacterium]|nr:hypothetical protein [Candidatus Eremiobacteraeota bacterium]